MKSLLLAAALLLAACGGGDDAAVDAGAPDAIPTDPLIEARPYGIIVPADYDGATPTPLILLLHGYSVSGYFQAAYWKFIGAVDREGFLLAHPDGLVDLSGEQFWNATDGCCNMDGSDVDDVAYLSAVLDDIEQRYNVDPRRIFVIGHSNGGFMSHRMACERGERIAAIVSLSGMTWADPAACPAGTPVNVLQVHGNVDQTILYQGGANAGQAAYPSAAETVATWAAKNGCTGALASAGASIDLDVEVAGAETRREAYAGCPAGGAVDFWTMEGVGHIPSFDDGWSTTVWAYLEAHARP